MADDSTKISANQKVRNLRRNSIGIPDSPHNGETMLPPLRRASVGGNLRRNSTGKPTSQNSGEHIIPNHLRAYTGSCHDMCKYGRKNANEVKPWKIKPKRPVASSSEEPSNISVVIGDRKNTKIVKLKPSPESPQVIKQNITSVVQGETKKTTMVKLKISREPPEVLERNTTVATRERKKTTVVNLEPSPEPPKASKKNKTAVVPRERKKTAMVKLEPSPEPAEVLKQTYTTLVPAGERKKATTRKLKSSPEPPEVIKREILLPSKKVELSLKQDSLCGKEIIDRDLKLPAKRFPSLKLKAALVKPPSSSDASVGSNGRRKNDMKTGKKPGPIKTVVKKGLVIPAVSLSPKSPFSRVLSFKARKGRNLKQVSPFKDQGQMPKSYPMQLQNDKVHEKTLHIVASEAGNKTDGIVQSFPGPQSSSALSFKSSLFANSQGSSYSEQDDLDYSVCTNSEDDYISENDEIMKPCGKETVPADGKRSPRKGKSILPEEKDGAAVKLKFRRGRIIDVQSEKNSPRRLRFRRGKVLGDGVDLSGGSRRRTYKKKSDEETKDSSRLGAEKVVLKHQEVVGKKDLQGLFNVVIEETASKLVETRKSKVKALVGAFETVISLQESKTSTQASPEWQFSKHL